MHSIIAYDLGAESGRTILGTIEEGRLSIRELNRFPNRTARLLGHLHWNFVELFERMKEGLAICASEGISPESLAVDTWGVDFGLLASDGSLLGLPYGYRDNRTEGMMEAFYERMPARRLYELTGIQHMPFNTVYQLFSMVAGKSPLLDIAEDLLFMPDLLNYLFTGAKHAEFTISTTSQMYNPFKKDWDDEVLAAAGIPRKILQKIVQPGTVVGEIMPDIRRETGIDSVKVIATASHDTGAAVAAVPAEGDDWAFISSGTWSVVGIVSPEPVICDASSNFLVSSEGGVGGTFRVLKNVMGLWLIQQCRKSWSREKLYGYDELIQMGAAAPEFVSLVDPDDARFLNPLDMPSEIAGFCRDTGQPVPDSPGEFVRCVMESLALKYRMAVEYLRDASGNPINRLHIIGGGAQNRLLCQFTADACDIPVIGGPFEATALGNLGVQAMALGYVDSPQGIRDLVRRSFELETYEPRDTREWDAAYVRFCEIVAGGNK